MKMNIKLPKLPGKITRKVGRAQLRLKKASPEIMLVAGIGCGLASTVTAVIATTKMPALKEEADDRISTIKAYLASEKMQEDMADKYSVAEAEHDLTTVRVDTALHIAKLYAPSVILAAASVGFICGSHNVLSKRNAALTAAYATVEKSFKEYRDRVATRYGDEIEKEIRYNIQSKEVEQTVKDENTGEEKTVTTTEKVVGLDGISDYAKFFDESCEEYVDGDPEYNLTFLKFQQDAANDRLRAKGHLFLNDVYEMLGIKPTRTGQFVGWVYEENNPVGDNFVDFGIYETKRESNRRFVNGLESVILLDFNCDGNILKYL